MTKRGEKMSEDFEKENVKWLRVELLTNPLKTTFSYGHSNDDIHTDDVTGETIEVRIQPDGQTIATLINARKRYFQFKPSVKGEE